MEYKYKISNFNDIGELRVMIKALHENGYRDLGNYLTKGFHYIYEDYDCVLINDQRKVIDYCNNGYGSGVYIDSLTELYGLLGVSKKSSAQGTILKFNFINNGN